MDVGISETGFWAVIGAILASVGGAFAWGQKSIGDAKRELRREMDDIREVMRQDQISARQYREAMLTRLGEVPTRADLRDALREHEERVLHLIENNNRARH